MFLTFFVGLGFSSFVNWSEWICTLYHEGEARLIQELTEYFKHLTPEDCRESEICFPAVSVAMMGMRVVAILQLFHIDLTLWGTSGSCYSMERTLRAMLFNNDVPLDVKKVGNISLQL